MFPLPLVLFVVAAACSTTTGASPPVPHQREYALTPPSRTVRPKSIYNVSGNVTGADYMLAAAANTTDEAHVMTLDPNASVTFDFGQNLVGLVTFVVGSVTGDTNNAAIATTFTESSDWIDSEYCDSTADGGRDRPLTWKVSSGQQYGADRWHQRAYRYLTVSNAANASDDGSSAVSLTSLAMYYSGAPHVSDERFEKNGTLAGFFHCNDEDINKVWYAAAYTLELCMIESHEGDALIYFGEAAPTTIADWHSNKTASSVAPVIVTDGAKRDRLIWSGDLGIALSSALVSHDAFDVLVGTSDSLLHIQKEDGLMPFAGEPLNTSVHGSTFLTYHFWTMESVKHLYLHSGNLTYLEERWPAYKKALLYGMSLIDKTGMVNDSAGLSWNLGTVSGHSAAVNALCYAAMQNALFFAKELGLNNQTFTDMVSSRAEQLKNATMETLWDPAENLYRASDLKPDLYPQDGNALAVIHGLIMNNEHAANISGALQHRWGQYGAPSPELGGISPFSSGFELQAHYIAKRPETAVALIKLMWSDFLLKDPRMTQSTFIEGYSINGSLHYPAYENDPRVSHAHGWSAGPAYALTHLGAGLTFTGAGGSTWAVQPQLGGLSQIEAGYGNFSTSSHLLLGNKVEGAIKVSVNAPLDSSGTVVIPLSESLVDSDYPVTISIQSSEDGLTQSSRNITQAEKQSKLVSTDVDGGAHYVVLGE